MTVVMYDSIDVSQIPAAAMAVAGYVDGHWPDYPAEFKRWPNAHHVPITVFGSLHALCADCENGDLTPEQAVLWLKEKLREKRGKPWLYANRSTWAILFPLIDAEGIKHDEYVKWVADPQHTAHIPEGFDLCQWTFNALGRNLDESVCHDYVFDIPVVRHSPYWMLTPEEKHAVEKYLKVRGGPHDDTALMSCIMLRKAVWFAAVKGQLLNGKRTLPGWHRQHREERYHALGLVTKWMHP